MARSRFPDHLSGRRRNCAATVESGTRLQLQAGAPLATPMLHCSPELDRFRRARADLPDRSDAVAPRVAGTDGHLPTPRSVGRQRRVRGSGCDGVAAVSANREAGGGLQAARPRGTVRPSRGAPNGFVQARRVRPFARHTVRAPQPGKPTSPRRPGPLRDTSEQFPRCLPQPRSRSRPSCLSVQGRINCHRRGRDSALPSASAPPHRPGANPRARSAGPLNSSDGAVQVTCDPASKATINEPRVLQARRGGGVRSSDRRRSSPLQIALA